MPSGDHLPPSMWRVLGEVRSLPHRMRFAPVRRAARGRDGGGRPVMVIPGFMVHDVISTRLRRTMSMAGYAPEGWGLGFNRGLRDGAFDGMVSRLEDMAARRGRPVSLVGWSLGGLFAREAAKLRPHLVERVVTLASPFSGGRRANNVWRIYEKVAGHPIDSPPIEVEEWVKPPVPTIALWSASDGLIAPASARGLEGERDLAVEVRCGHLDIISSPKAIAAVLDVLGMDVDRFRI